MAIPGPPVFEEETRDQIQKLLAKGASGGLFFATDDAQKSYEELKGRGVEFTQEPTEQPYGIDAGFRDPSGNHFRMAQSRSSSADSSWTHDALVSGPYMPIAWYPGRRTASCR